MMRHTKLLHEYVEFIPENLEPGYLYISRRFKTASHLCCCGCGSKVVTPLNPSKWRLIEHGETISLSPSIGNWSFPCQSHYFVKHGKVIWAKKIAKYQIAEVQRHDLADARSYSGHRNILDKLVDMIKSWLGVK